MFVVGITNTPSYCIVDMPGYSRQTCLSILLKETGVFAKFDKFLPVRSHFDTKRPVNFFHIATFPSPTFGPLFAFHCPLFFTKNNNLECRDVLKTVTVTSDQKRFGPYTAHN